MPGDKMCILEHHADMQGKLDAGSDCSLQNKMQLLTLSMSW